MPAGFSNDTQMIVSYGVPVRSNLDATTAYKVATVLLRAMKSTGASLLVHLQPMRIYSANFKGGDITIVNRSPVLGICWSAPEEPSTEENRCCLKNRHIRVIGSGVPRLFSLR
jgi:hypothetical protein